MNTVIHSNTAPPERPFPNRAKSRSANELLPRVLEYTGGNQHQAAQLLGIARQTLRQKLRDLALHVTHSVEADDQDPA